MAQISLPGPVAVALALLLLSAFLRYIEGASPLSLEVPTEIYDPSIEKCPKNCRCEISPILGRDCGVTADCVDWVVFPQAHEYPNGIECLIVQAPLLGALDISVREKGIQNIPPTVRRLELVKCQLEELTDRAFEHLPELRILRLELNRFTTFPAQAFYGLRFLKVLSLAGNTLKPGDQKYEIYQGYSNKIESLHDSQFHSLENLQVLNLHSNHLQELTPSLFVDQKKLRVLRLSNNQWKKKLSRDDVVFKSLLDSKVLAQLDLDTDGSPELENYFWDTNSSLSDDYGGPGPLPRPHWAQKLAAERKAEKKRKQQEEKQKRKQQEL